MVLGEAPLCHLTIYGSGEFILEDTLAVEADDNAVDSSPRATGGTLALPKPRPATPFTFR